MLAGIRIVLTLAFVALINLNNVGKEWMDGGMR
jgi:hypothetical protein